VSNTNQAWVIFKSKFIYDFVYNYITQLYKQKTYTVQLKCGVEKYSDDFLEGYLLGLALSDGYLKNKFYFNVTSKKLSINMIDILIRFGYTPRAYILKREKYGWKDLHMVRLISSETRNLNEFLDEILKRLSCAYTFKELKYENIEMGTA